MLGHRDKGVNADVRIHRPGTPRTLGSRTRVRNGTPSPAGRTHPISLEPAPPAQLTWRTREDSRFDRAAAEPREAAETTDQDGMGMEEQ
jgi:hypothetical protein